MRRFKRYLWILVLALVLSGCQVVGLGGGESEELTIAMGFIPNVQFAPMYVAIERDYFAEEGLQIQLDYGMETDLLQLVGTGKLEFAVASGDQVILARASELPVTYVLNWYRRFPVCVISMADGGISEPKDLVGKTVGIPAMSGASYIGWLAFLDQVGISPDAVNLQSIGYTQVASLTEGRVDAVVGYSLNEPIQLKELGNDINVFYLDEYTHLVSNGLITNETTIEKRSKVVQKVTRAFLRGLTDTIDDPDAAFEIVRKVIPEMDDESARLQRVVLGEAIAFWRGDPVGASVPEHWEESVSFLKELGLLSVDLEPTSLYTNKYVK